MLLGACSAPEREQAPAVPAGFVQHTIVWQPKPELASPTGSLTLAVPAQYDTLLTWLDAADTPNGDRCKYRMGSSSGCLRQESGFYREGTFCKDTLDRLTISTKTSFGTPESLTSLARYIQHTNEANQSVGAPPTVWKSKKVKVINGRPFSIVEFIGPAPGFRSLMLRCGQLLWSRAGTARGK
ncbi:hypothetical protein [Hymenobacter cellulosilyticus]|uniref:Uncharacterized protein n=1 Tax=Hymenobacter cellulosilyticus TaxID=2932248 RepID=A0A8T9Q3S0_9BACT|nr:hypothetical protein [Hymenobacter cellulosilyticus]UOQ70109.1 hypothetical protein MUN79_15165 [Hymenobacter cellulosilyticus]